MKILYLVHQFFPRDVGGTEIYLRGLATRAQANGFTPLIVTYVESPHVGEPYLHSTVVDTLPVIEVHGNYSQSRRPGRDEYANPAIGKLLHQVLKESSPDIVHVVHSMKLGAQGMRLCEKLAIPMVATLCDFWFICPRYTLMRPNGDCCSGPADVSDCLNCMRATHTESSFRIYARRAAAITRPWHRFQHRLDLSRRLGYLRHCLLACKKIIALSEFTKRMHVEHGIPASLISVIPHGLEELPTTAPSPPPEDLHVVFIGSLVPHKGAHKLLEALGNIPDVKLRCSIYGGLRSNDPYHRQLIELANRDTRVTLAGTFPPERIWRILDTASLLALPSLWYENEPLVVKAALHRGVPVLASELGSLVDQIRHGTNGWLLQPGDVGAMAGILEQLAKHPERCRVAPVYDAGMDEHARHVFSFYKEIIADAEPNTLSG